MLGVLICVLTLFPVFVGISPGVNIQEKWKRTPVSMVLNILPQIMGLPIILGELS